jgi:hypothetical protein
MDLDCSTRMRPAYEIAAFYHRLRRHSHFEASALSTACVLVKSATSVLELSSERRWALDRFVFSIVTYHFDRAHSALTAHCTPNSTRIAFGYHTVGLFSDETQIIWPILQFRV